MVLSGCQVQRRLAGAIRPRRLRSAREQELESLCSSMTRALRKDMKGCTALLILRVRIGSARHERSNQEPVASARRKMQRCEAAIVFARDVRAPGKQDSRYIGTLLRDGEMQRSHAKSVLNIGVRPVRQEERHHPGISGPTLRRKGIGSFAFRRISAPRHARRSMERRVAIRISAIHLRTTTDNQHLCDEGVLAFCNVMK